MSHVRISRTAARICISVSGSRQEGSKCMSTHSDASFPPLHKYGRHTKLHRRCLRAAKCGLHQESRQHCIGIEPATGFAVSLYLQYECTCIDGRIITAMHSLSVPCCCCPSCNGALRCSVWMQMLTMDMHRFSPTCRSRDFFYQGGLQQQLSTVCSRV